VFSDLHVNRKTSAVAMEVGSARQCSPRQRHRMVPIHSRHTLIQSAVDDVAGGSTFRLNVSTFRWIGGV